MYHPFAPAEARRTVPARPEVVWRVIADPDTYPSWLVGAQRMRSVDPDFPAPGSHLHHSVGPSPAVTVDDDSTATLAAPPNQLDLEVHVGPFRAAVELLIRGDATGSEIRFRERPMGLPRVLTPLLRPLLHVRNAESLRRLAGILETPSVASDG